MASQILVSGGYVYANVPGIFSLWYVAVAYFMWQTYRRGGRNNGTLWYIAIVMMIESSSWQAVKNGEHDHPQLLLELPSSFLLVLKVDQRGPSSTCLSIPDFQCLREGPFLRVKADLGRKFLEAFRPDSLPFCLRYLVLLLCTQSSRKWRNFRMSETSTPPLARAKRTL